MQGGTAAVGATGLARQQGERGSRGRQVRVALAAETLQPHPHHPSVCNIL